MPRRIQEPSCACSMLYMVQYSLCFFPRMCFSAGNAGRHRYSLRLKGPLSHVSLKAERGVPLGRLRREPVPGVVPGTERGVTASAFGEPNSPWEDGNGEAPLSRLHKMTTRR